MGKRVRPQRRGRGTPTYRTPPYACTPTITFLNSPGIVEDIIHYQLANSPLAKIRHENGAVSYCIAPEGTRVGAPTTFIKPLSDIPEGTQVCAIETQPNAGPKLCRSPGSSATLISRSPKECTIQLPSKKSRTFSPRCRAVVGVPAGEGRLEKPFMKAGNKYYARKQKGKLYPITSGVAMNAYDHPFGASGSGKPRPPVSRHAPPGKKVGTFASKGTGRQR